MPAPGKAFEYEWSLSFRHFSATHPHFWWKRWPDFQDFSKNAKYRAPRAPGDFVALYNSTFYVFEMKSTKGTNFSMSWLKDHQRASLLAVKRAGGRALVVIGHRAKPFRCWLLDISDYLYLESLWKGEGRKSIPIESIAKAGLRVKRINIKTTKRRKGKKGWQISPFFERRESLEGWFTDENNIQ